MGIRIFKITLLLVGLITFLHAVIPHEHHSEKEEHAHHHHNHNDSSFFDFLELAFHNGQSYGASDSFTIEEDINQNNLIADEPQLLKWLREKELFVYYSITYQENSSYSHFSGFTQELRGPPCMLA